MTIVQSAHEIIQSIVIVGLQPFRRDGLVLQEGFIGREKVSYGDQE
jgi:hypothetical protein